MAESPFKSSIKRDDLNIRDQNQEARMGKETRFMGIYFMLDYLSARYLRNLFFYDDVYTAN